MLTRLGPAAKMPFGIHPHILRHSTGFKLANQCVDTRSLQHSLGHKNIQHTVRYRELSPDRFRDFWGFETSGKTSGGLRSGAGGWLETSGCVLINAPNRHTTSVV